MNPIKLFFLSLLAMALTACGGEGGGLPSQGGGETVPAIVSLQVTPATKAVPVGFSQQYIALATLADGSIMDVTKDPVVRWSTRYWYHIPTTVGIGVTTKQSKAHQCIIRDCGIRPDSCMDMANRFRKNPRQVCYPSCMNIGMIKRPPGASGSSVR